MSHSIKVRKDWNLWSRNKVHMNLKKVLETAQGPNVLFTLIRTSFSSWLSRELNDNCYFPSTGRFPGALFLTHTFPWTWNTLSLLINLRAPVQPSRSILSLTHNIAFRPPFCFTVGLPIFFSSVVHSLVIQQALLEHLTGARKLGLKAKKPTKAWAFCRLWRVYS